MSSTVCTVVSFVKLMGDRVREKGILCLIVGVVVLCVSTVLIVGGVSRSEGICAGSSQRVSFIVYVCVWVGVYMLV